MPWRCAGLAGAAGNLVPALLYAITGAIATSLTSQTLVFGVVIAVAAACWLITRRATESTSPTPGGSSTSSRRAEEAAR